MRLSGQLFLPHDPAKARIGEIASWTTRSSRDPDIWYTQTLYPDGHWECDCPAGQYGSRADGLCKHIDFRRKAWEQTPDLVDAA
jgi:hypothetical protein